jgi:hypothetical protein
MPSSILSGTGPFTPTIEEQKQSAKDSRYPALRDVKRGLELGARYILVFTVDLSNPANADALAYADQHVSPSVMPDCSGHNLSLVPSGRVMPVPGESNQPNAYAQFFDGSTGTLSASRASLTDTGNWSLEAWIYPTALPQNGALVVMNGADGTNGGGFGFGIGDANGGTGSRLVGYLPNVGWIDSGYTFTAVRQWYHVVVTRDGRTIRFYVNGQQTPNTSSLSPNAVPAHCSIGSGYNLDTGAAAHFFTGAIDEVATYTHALSPAQIKAHFKTMKKGK